MDKSSFAVRMGVVFNQSAVPSAGSLHSRFQALSSPVNIWDVFGSQLSA